MSIKDELNQIPYDDFGFQKVSESIVGEEKERLEQVERGQTFGVKFLDETLRAIEIDDLILIGALPGVGKTQLVTNIALKNALKGKRVHLFALEAGKREIERRMKFQLVMKHYYQETKDYEFRLAYYDWYRGAAKERLEPYVRLAEDEMRGLKSLHVFYRHQRFGVTEFRRAFLGISKETDLVIVDHLHYFSLDDDNENKAVKEIMMEMRDLVLISQVPIILVAHLRKADKAILSLAPDLSEFHGTSEIGKIVTKAVTLGPGEHEGNGIYSTFVRIAKCRQDGGVTKFLMKVFWDAKVNNYKNSYALGTETLTKKGKEFRPIPINDDGVKPLFLESQKHYKGASGE